MSDADRRVALVTGASRGIGRAIAQRLARDGRRVVLCARSEAPLNDLRAQIEMNGGCADVLAVDVADSGALAKGIEGVAEKHGRLDILVNNAGITRDMLALRMSDEDWGAVIQTNLTAAFVACRAAARSMMRGKFGRIVSIASTSGLVGNAGQCNYAAAKSGLIGLTKSLARELGGKGITANVVAPGFIETDMTKDLPQNIRDAVLGAMSIKRLGLADDVASLVSYVASDEAGFLTGQTIAIDGGLTMC